MRAIVSDLARRPQRLTLDVLGMYVRRPDEQVWSSGMVALLGDLGFSVGASRIAVQRLITRGLLRRLRDGRRVRLALSTTGETLLREGDERIFGFGRHPIADDRWTVVWHQLPPSRHADRQRLAGRLRFGAFGPLRDGVWVAPGDRSVLVTCAVRDLGLDAQVGILVGRQAGAFDPARIWDREALLERYQAFLTRVEQVAGGEALSDRDAFCHRADLMYSFQRLTRHDAELPRDRDVERARTRALELFDDRYLRLRGPATRHVEAALGAAQERRG